MTRVLNTLDHRRDSARLTYVYPVISRRAGGVSIGINLNVNNACNWGCIYCQVENLSRGGPPPVDLDLLEEELRQFLQDATTGNFMAERVPPESRRLVDIAFSGNGEPTSAAEFSAAVARVEAVVGSIPELPPLTVRLITNGSLLHRPAVQAGIRALARLPGEVWFKLDRATPQGMHQVNKSESPMEAVSSRLATCCRLAPTWLQTCWFALDGTPPGADEENAYLDFVSQHAADLCGILLYGIARPSQQPEAPRLSPLPLANLEAFARRIHLNTGLTVQTSP